MKSLRLRSFAKLNLYLEVLNKRPDNYHNILTVFERINLFDEIYLKTLPNKEIRVISSHPCLPKNSNNLTYSAAYLLQKEFNITRGVEIKIKKNIPIAAGLGGGSSNAATVLEGLNQLWRLNLKTRRLVALGRQIGADVAFFLYHSPFALARGRGDEVVVLKSSPVLWHILVVPRIKINTSLIYKRWDETKRRSIVRGAGLTNEQSAGKILFNCLEKITQRFCPEIKRIKQTLYNLGIRAISMSGSGPAVFGIVSSRKEAYAVARRINNPKDWEIFVVRTI